MGAMSSWKLWPLAFLVAASAARAQPAPAPAPEIARIELAKPFTTRSPWRFTATQGPPTVDYGDNPAPGAVELCLRKGADGPCLSAPVSPLRITDGKPDLDWGPHYLQAAGAVYPNGRGAPPLLRIVTASLHAGDGGQLVATQLLKYDPARDAFARIYFHLTGTNNNEEVRFITAGPLQGAVVEAEPTPNAPYGYWITVNRLTPALTYRQALRYRSATRYADGNPLAVIDSEMPSIQQRLGLWKPGSPLPLPPGRACPRPVLKQGALWCE
jgi:hypothetical protein